MRCWEVQEQGGQIRALPKAQGETLWYHEIIIIIVYNSIDRRINHVSILRSANILFTE